MSGKHLLDQCDPLRGWNVGQADQTTLGQLADEDEMAEVGIDGYQHAVVSSGLLQEALVTRITPEATCLDDIVTLSPQPVGKAPAGTTVDQESHLTATATASSESFAIAAWA